VNWTSVLVVVHIHHTVSGKVMMCAADSDDLATLVNGLGGSQDDI
jgi:hypothetical protein